MTDSLARTVPATGAVKRTTRRVVEGGCGAPAFRAYCPALESIGAATWGNTREEAVKHIGEVLYMIVEELAKEGKEIPPDALIASTQSSAVVVSV